MKRILLGLSSLFLQPPATSMVDMRIPPCTTGLII
jgi:hypothetical protein